MEPQFAVLIGIDCVDQKHVWAMEMPGTPEAVDPWAAKLAGRFGGQPIAIALEQS